MYPKLGLEWITDGCSTEEGDQNDSNEYIHILEYEYIHIHLV